MKKILALLVLSGTSLFAQVGINTTSPNAQLDVRSTNQAAPSNQDGILIPKIDAFPATNPTAAQHGMMVFLTTTSGSNLPGFYYWDNPAGWRNVSGEKGWGLTGNSGTNPSVNFIGTINDADFAFRRFDQPAGIVGVTNVSLGVNALNVNNVGFYNLAFGSNTLSSNTIGQENIAFGDGALFENTTGSGNIANGSDALRLNQTGDSNVAVGKMALRGNTSGDSNFALGDNALTNNDSGNTNIAIGMSSLFANSTGSDNIAIGSNALNINNTGSYNIALGSSLVNSTNGDNNIAIGAQTGMNVSGSNNIVLGYQADVPLMGTDNQLSISNTIYGSDIGSAAARIGIGEPEPIEKLHVRGNLKLGEESIWTSTADDKSIRFGDGDFCEIGEVDGDDSMVFKAYYFSFNAAYGNGNVGIGTAGAPTEKLDVAGKTKTVNFQMTNGAAANRVLTSDALGNATWTAPTANASFFEVGTTIPPDAITDAMFHMGNTAIGKNTASYKLDVAETSGSNLSAAQFTHTNPTSTVLATNVVTHQISAPAALTSGAIVGANNAVTVANAVSGAGTTNFVSGTTTNASYGTQNFVSAAGTGFRYGTSNILSGTGTGQAVGTRNNMSSSANNLLIGVENDFSGANGASYVGMMNRMNSTGTNVVSQGGTRTLFSNPSTADAYGHDVSFDAGSSGAANKYGFRFFAHPSTAGTIYGIHSTATSAGSYAGYFLGKAYIDHTQATAEGDGQRNLYVRRSRDAANPGTGYSITEINTGITSFNAWTDNYSFSINGCYSTISGVRSGGVLGGSSNASSWGCVGYINSGGTAYGLYSTTATATGAGRYAANAVHEGIGAGFYGGLIGSWSRGSMMGSMSSGSLFAHYNSGDEYTAGKQVELVQTSNGTAAAFTVTSTEVVIYTKGKVNLLNGSARVTFPDHYKRLIKDAPVVTATPMGPCNGVFIESIDENGFTLREQNSGSGSVTVSWICVADRIDQNQNKVPDTMLSANLDQNLNGVMFNENNRENAATSVSGSGTSLEFGTAKPSGN